METAQVFGLFQVTVLHVPIACFWDARPGFARLRPVDGAAHSLASVCETQSLGKETSNYAHEVEYEGNHDDQKGECQRAKVPDARAILHEIYQRPNHEGSRHNELNYHR